MLTGSLQGNCVEPMAPYDLKDPALLGDTLEEYDKIHVLGSRG